MRGAQRRPLFSRRHNYQSEQGRGRSAESDSENVIFVGYQPEAEAGCCMLYGSVALDREILARQNHLENAR